MCTRSPLCFVFFFLFYFFYLFVCVCTQDKSNGHITQKQRWRRMNARKKRAKHLPRNREYDHDISSFLICIVKRPYPFFIVKMIATKTVVWKHTYACIWLKKGGGKSQLLGSNALLKARKKELYTFYHFGNGEEFSCNFMVVYY